EGLDHSNRVLRADIIFQAVRKQCLLQPIFAIDEPMHRQAPEAPGSFIRSALPETWTRACWLDVSPPRRAAGPTAPSIPIIPTSIVVASAIFVRIETTPSLMK